MNAYTHILAAIDLSPETEQLLQRAVNIRDKFASRLSLIHVVEPLPMIYAGDLTLINSLDLDMEEQIMAAARPQLLKLGENIGVPEANCHLVMGSIAEQVLRVVQDNKVDLLVVGSHGRHGLALLFGSTADAILHRATCDMLAVRIHEIHS